MARINKTKYGLLSLLAKGALSGYDIKKLVKKVALFHWSESSSQIYPLLKQMEKEGLVTSSLDEKSGKRERRIYTITEKGNEDLLKWLQEKTAPTIYREELILKITAGEFVDTKVLLMHLESYYKEILLHEELLRTVQDDIISRYQNIPRKKFLLLAYDFSEKVFQAKKAWCEATITALKNEK